MRWMIRLWSQCLNQSFFGIGMGPSGDEKRQFGEVGSLSNFSTSLGEKNIGEASNFWSSILSGDPSKIAQVLGPEISAINQQGQQKKKTAAEFGNRGGGTNAGMQMTDDTTRSSVDSLFSDLTKSAAGALESSGSSLLSTGLAGHEAAFGEAKDIHDQESAKLNDLFKSITEVAAAPFTGGMSLGMGSLKLPGSGGGGPFPTYDPNAGGYDPVTGKYN